jgi:hypothetical protein
MGISKQGQVLSGISQHIEGGACYSMEISRLVFKDVEEQMNLVGTVGGKDNKLQAFQGNSIRGNGEASNQLY